MMHLSRRYCFDAGMTLVEMVIAIAMLVIFTSVVATVLSFTQRFQRQAETLDGTDTLLSSARVNSNGLLLDHHQLQVAMDQLVDQLQQPALSGDQLRAIATDRSRQCSFSPVSEWGLMGPPVVLPGMPAPPLYRICLSSTPLAEPSMQGLLGGQPPGIYVLRALPEQLNASTLPSRRLFCRPRPFC